MIEKKLSVGDHQPRGAFSPASHQPPPNAFVDFVNFYDFIYLIFFFKIYFFILGSSEAYFLAGTQARRDYGPYRNGSFT